MKTRFKNFLLLLLLLPAYACAQKKILVEEVIKEMSKGMHTGFEVMIPEVSLRDVKNDFNKYLRRDSKGKVTEDKNESFITGAVHKNISSNPFNLYYKMRASDDGVTLTGFFTENDTVFFSKAVSDDQAEAVKKYLRDFAVKEYKSEVAGEVEVQTRKQKELENKLEDLVHERQKSERNINASKRTIENNNNDIESYSKQLALKEEEILKQKGITGSLKGTGGEEEKLADKNLKNMESEKKKLNRQKEKLASENDKMNGKIEDEQRHIESNLNQQGDKKRDIENQKDKVKKTEEKLNGIL